jgi:MFS family permease
MMPTSGAAGQADGGFDSRASWRRLAVIVALGMIGGVGMWSVIVVLPAVQAEFGASRGEAALSYSLTLAGFALGGVVMGRLSDRRGIRLPVVLGTIVMSAG